MLLSKHHSSKPLFAATIHLTVLLHVLFLHQAASCDSFDTKLVKLKTLLVQEDLVNTFMYTPLNPALVNLQETTRTVRESALRPPLCAPIVTLSWGSSRIISPQLLWGTTCGSFSDLVYRTL